MRLFLGFAPAGAEREIFGLCDRLSAVAHSGLPDSETLRWVPPENWHITVAFLGEIAERSLGKLSDAVAPVVSERAPLSVQLDRLEWFPSPLKPRMLALHVDACPALLELQSAVTAALRREGFQLEQRAYRPHLTLARLRGSRKALEPPALMPVQPMTAELAELVLFESHRGARPYIPVQHFELAA